MSASRHPVSGRPVPTRGELQALALARTLGGEVVGLFAGADPAGPTQALGHGLDHLVHLRLPEGTDPVPALAEAVRADGFSLALAGPRSVGGDETGLVPYRLAGRLGWEIAAGIVAVARTSAGVEVTEALPRGARRVLASARPLIAIAHAGAPAPAPYAYAQERRGRVERREPAAPDEMHPSGMVEERPLRRRAPIVADAATGAGTRLVGPTPEEAARAVLAELRRIRAIP
nr:electron transfer flavoprotein subunit beta [Aureimonas jatrophae]